MPVLNAKQGDILFIHAEAEQIVVALVLIPPDNARRLDPPRFGLDFEFDAQVAIPADYFVEDGERKFGILGSGGELLQNVGAGGRGFVRLDFPVRGVARAGLRCWSSAPACCPVADYRN